MRTSILPAEYFEQRYVVPHPGRTLIVGSRIFSDREDRRRRYADVLGVDMQAGDGVDRVLNLEEPLPADIGRFEHVECMSVLEHSRRPWLLAANLQKLMRKESTIFLSVPFVWRVHDYPGDYWRFTQDGVRSLFPGILWHRMANVSDQLKMNDMVPVMDSPDGHPYLARTEVLGFGVRT